MIEAGGKPRSEKTVDIASFDRFAGADDVLSNVPYFSSGQHLDNFKLQSLFERKAVV